VRLFVAVEFPVAVRDRVWDETAPLRETTRAVRWVPPALMHATLTFLGERPPESRDAIDAALVGATRGHAPIAGALRGLGAFPNFRRPRVVWLGIDDGGQLARVAADVDTALQPLGVERERRGFTPHLTLGRVREGAPPAELDALRVAAERTRLEHPVSIDHIALVRSTLGAGGPRYDVLQSIPLGGGAT
jgi:2'-5' RNA ligase